MPIITADDLLSPDAATPPPSTGPAPGPAGSSSRTTGVRERRDKTPKTSARRATAGRPSNVEKMSAETKAIGAALGQLLSMPGAIFGMIGEPFLGDTIALTQDGKPIPDGEGGYRVNAGHFTRTGPSFGMQLAKASETNPALRRILKSAMSGDSLAILLMGGIAYAAPPLIYLLTPNHSPIRSTFGVPPRPGRSMDPGPDPFAAAGADHDEPAGDE